MMCFAKAITVSLCAAFVHDIHRLICSSLTANMTCLAEATTFKSDMMCDMMTSYKNNVLRRSRNRRRSKAKRWFAQLLNCVSFFLAILVSDQGVIEQCISLLRSSACHFLGAVMNTRGVIQFCVLLVCEHVSNRGGAVIPRGEGPLRLCKSSYVLTVALSISEQISAVLADRSSEDLVGDGHTCGVMPCLSVSLCLFSQSSYVPMGAVSISKKVADVLADGSKDGLLGHGYTFGGHPVACAVGIECLNLYDELNVLANTRARSFELMEGLWILCGGSEIVGEVSCAFGKSLVAFFLLCEHS